MRRTGVVAVTFACATAMLAVVAPAAVAKTKLPLEPCDLVTDSQLEDVGVVGATGDDNEPTKSDYRSTCEWESPEPEGAVVLIEIETTASKKVAISDLKVKRSQDDGKRIKHLGDYAYQWFETDQRTEVKMVAKGLRIDVHLVGGEPLTKSQKSKVVSIAKSIVKKL